MKIPSSITFSMLKNKSMEKGDQSYFYLSFMLIKPWKRRKGEGKLGSLFEFWNNPLYHSWTWHLFASMYYSWVIHYLWVTIIHMSHHTPPTSYSSSHPWLVFWSSSHYINGSHQVNSSNSNLFFVPICSREVVPC